MKVFRLILISWLIALVFLGNYGVREFIHRCNEEGTSSSFFVESKNHCALEETSPCCNEKEEKTTSDCCSGSLNIYQIEFQDYRLNQIDHVFSTDNLIPETAKILYQINKSVSTEILLNNFYTDPPPDLKLPVYLKNRVLRL